MKCNSKFYMIGGKFGLENLSISSNSSPPFLKGSEILLVNARSGISLLIELLSPKQVWMPSYLCNAMIKAIHRSETLVKFYEVNYNLKIPSIDWVSNILPGDIVVFVDYFGFSFDMHYATLVKQKGAWILEDASQSLLSEADCEISDFILYSPRKFVGVPDGGIVNFNNGFKIDNIKLEQPPREWWLKSFYAMIMRREYDRFGINQHWLKMFQEVADQQPIGHFAMSELSQILLSQGFDYLFVIERRRENYRFLTSELEEIALFPELGIGTVPLGFPIHLKARECVRKTLFDKGIYATVHWPIHSFVPHIFQESHQLANEILTLPCDQRYNLNDMFYIVSTIRDILE